MKKLLSFGLFCLVVFSLLTPSAWAQPQECPYKTAWQSRKDGIVITLTAIVDSLTIHNVSVNRGNCLAVRPEDYMVMGMDPMFQSLAAEVNSGKMSGAEFWKKMNEKYSPRLVPAKLGFGDTFQVVSSIDCKLLEIRVETDQGSWTTSFN